LSGAAAVLAAVIAAWNPPLVASRRAGLDGRRWVGMTLAAAATLGVALAADPILDALDVSAPTFRSAAGAVLAASGARWFVGPRPKPDDGPPLVLGIVDVVTPALLFAVTATTASSGWGVTATGVVVAALVTAALQRLPLPPAVMPWLTRLVAGGALGLGVALIYAGIRAV